MQWWTFPRRMGYRDHFKKYTWSKHNYCNWDYITHFVIHVYVFVGYKVWINPNISVFYAEPGITLNITCDSDCSNGCHKYWQYEDVIWKFFVEQRVQLNVPLKGVESYRCTVADRNRKRFHSTTFKIFKRGKWVYIHNKLWVTNGFEIFNMTFHQLNLYVYQAHNRWQTAEVLLLLVRAFASHDRGWLIKIGHGLPLLIILSMSVLL